MKKFDKNGNLLVESFFTKSDFVKSGIYKYPAGYTPNSWRGKNCPNRFLPVKEVAGYIRDFIKKDEELNACKWSITTDSYSGGQSITIALMKAPFEAISEEWKQKHPFDAKHNYTQHGDIEEAVTEKAFAVISKVKNFALSYNYDDSDGMIDYCDRGFYDKYYIGKYDKPFEVIEAKETKKETKIQRNGLEIVDYSEKAVAVIGDTIKFKEKLKALGGKFNARLSCGAGWIFSKKRESELREMLQAI